jgi:4-amino-4-deoxy-L-arabinose transferase-like glycosyltransferase
MSELSVPQSFSKMKLNLKVNDLTVLILLGLAGVILHTLANGQYGFHRDELDILMNARQLDWGYVAYPPVTPFLARLGLELFGPSLMGARFPVALAQGVAMVLVGLMARDMGGGRRAQIIAALAAAIAPIALISGTLMQYMSFDYLWWVLVAFFTVRLLKTDDPRWWLGIGTGIGLGMLTKYTMIFFAAGLVAGTLLTPARRYLRSPWLWAGVGLALLIFLPNLVWQIRHNFISLDFLSAIHARDIAWGRAEDFWPKQIYATANPFTLPLWLAGLIFCLFAKGGQQFRLLGWMYLVTLALLWLGKGRYYYVGPAYAMLLAAGAVWLESWAATLTQTKARLVYGLAWSLLALGAVIGAVTSKPIAPLNSPLWEVVSSINNEFTEMVGWPDLAAQVAEIYNGLPAEDKPGTVILAGNYGEAGAFDLYGPAYGLPPAISGTNSLWARGYGDTAPQTVIVVGFDRQQANRFFKSCEAKGIVRNQYGVKNEESSNHTAIYVCRQPRQPWAKMWPGMQWFQ